MKKAKETTQKPASDRTVEFQAALDAYILGYRRYHQNQRRPATATRVSIVRLLRGPRAWAPRTVLTNLISRGVSRKEVGADKRALAFFNQFAETATLSKHL
jgi:hypothetical protein